MAQDVQGMLIQIEATTAQLRREMAAADKTVAGTAKGIDRQLSGIDKSFDRLNRNSSGALAEIGRGFNLLTVSIRSASAMVGAFGAGAAFTRFVANTRNAEQEQAQLGAVLRSTGEAAGFNANQLNLMADSMEGQTTFSAGAITTAQTALLAFTGVVGTEFTRAMDSAANMSARTGLSLTQTAELIGRALDVPSKGMAALSRQGFRFTDEQRQLMKQLEATGRTAEAQGIILSALEESYGGAAAAARETLSGALLALGNTFDSLLTGRENALSGVTNAVNTLNAALSGPDARIAISALGDVIIAVSAVMAGRLVAAGTSAAAAFLAAQVQAVRYQATLAALAGVSRSAAVAITASATAARVASAALALIGGPVGAAVLAASAVGYFATRSSEAEREAEALDGRIRKLDGSFQSLTANQAAAAILDYEQKLSAAEATAGAAAARVFTLNDNISRFPGSPKQEQWREELVRANAALDTANQGVDEQKTKISQLTAIIEQNTSSRHGNNLANLEGIEAGEKYLKQLETQLNRMRDKTAVQAADRVITENQIDRESELAKRILSTAAAQDQQREADARATAGRKASIKETNQQEKAISAVLDGLKTQAATLGMSSQELERYRLEQAGATTAQLAMADGILNEISLRTEVAEAVKAHADQLQWLRAVQDQVSASQSGIDLSVRGIGMGDRARQELESLVAVQEQYARRREELSRQQGTANALPDDMFRARIEALRSAERQEVAIIQDGAQRKLDAQKDWTNGARRAMENYRDSAADIAGQVDGLFTNAFTSMEDSVTRFATTGKASFKDFASSILEDMARIASRQASSQLLGMVVQAGASYFGGAGGGAGATQAGYTGSAYSNWAATQAKGGAWTGGAQFFAKGGAFTNSVVNKPTAFGMAGGLGVMGEAGPEAIMPLMRGPDGSLGIQAYGGGSSGGAVVQLNAPIAITMEDRSSEGMELDQEALSRNMQRELQQVAQKVVADSWRPGGISYRQTQGRV